MTTQSLKTRITDDGLKVPVIDTSLNPKGKLLSQPETLRQSILELLLTPKELESLVIVKFDKDSQEKDPLAQVKFKDGIRREVIFSSGTNVYYGDKNLINKIRQAFFGTELSNACRYGSLLVSSCLEGATILDSNQDNKPLRIKIVDFDSPEGRKFQTGDCRGIISPRIAQLIGVKDARPFQFRLAYDTNWGKSDSNTPDTSFLAKGTFIPDEYLTDEQGYDIILDRSSIKGIAQDQMEQLIPCGDYALPKTIIGNRSNAKLQEYENSWQFNIWFSEDALRQDIIPDTIREAKRLTQLQENPQQLARYIVEQYDRKKQYYSANYNPDEEIQLEENETQSEQKNESSLITILRNDTRGTLLQFPKIVDFMRSQLARRWCDLAIKGAIHHNSAMAQPCNDLKPGTIVAPHLKDGTEVIITRYPIVSKDNIRRYTVNNKQPAARQFNLTRFKGCVFIRPDQAMQHHQCDFDGDQLVVTPCDRLPTISKQIRHANEPNEFPVVTKRAKVNYQGKLRQITTAIPKNKIGIVATKIGRIVSIDLPLDSINYQLRQKFLKQLFNALQIEVDSPKSAKRLEDFFPNLLKIANKWQEKYPSDFFEYKTHQQLYRTAPLPTETKSHINVIADEAVNPLWQKARITSLNREHFRFLFQKPAQLDPQTWEEYLDWAREIKDDYYQRCKEIYQLYHNEKRIKEEFAKLYADLRAEIDEVTSDPNKRLLLAQAMGNITTTPTNQSQIIKHCQRVAKGLKPEFKEIENHQFLHDLKPKNTYVLSIPFGDGSDDDDVNKMRKFLDAKGQQYEALCDETLPMINFALINPSEILVNTLSKYYGNNQNIIDLESLVFYDEWNDKESQMIIPPKSYSSWIENTEDIHPKAALVCSLFPEELSLLSEQYKFSHATLVGQAYNECKDIDFNSAKWKNKPVELTVGMMNNPGTPYHNRPVVQLNGKNLAPFSGESPKLPIGSTFTASITTQGSSLHLDIDTDSIQFPVTQALSKSFQQFKPKLPRLEYRQEDILKVEHGIIVQQVNCQGVMGGYRNGQPGLAQQIVDKYSKVKQYYLEKHQRQGWKLGQVQVVCINPDNNLFVANVAGQLNYGKNAIQTDLKALRFGLRKLAKYAAKHDLPLHIPQGLGSGLAGGKTKEERKKTWQTVQQIISEECPNAIIYSYHSQVKKQSEQDFQETSTQLRNNQSEQDFQETSTQLRNNQSEQDFQETSTQLRNNQAVTTINQTDESITALANQTLAELVDSFYLSHSYNSDSLTKIDLNEIIEGWILRVDNKHKKCYVQERDATRSTVFSFNLENQQVEKQLNAKNAQHLIRQLTIFNEKQETQAGSKHHQPNQPQI